MFDKIIAHTSFIGETGYANHSRNFFTALNKIIPVKVRNFPAGKTWNGLNNGEPHNNEWYLTDEHKEMLYKQTCMDGDKRTDYYIYGGNKEVEEGNNLHIILNETNHYYFYDKYDGPKIAYNVWESTLYPNGFFKRLLDFDQLWVPTRWQKDCAVKQGYLENKIKIVPEAVNGSIFFPEDILKENSLEGYKDSRFKFLLFGRWDYRKSTGEIINSFLETFNKDEPVDLIVSIDNPFSVDKIKTTEDRLKHYGFDDDRIKIKHFPSREDYVRYLKSGHVFLSCARSEGWNLPLIEAMACGTPSIYSNWGAQLEFAQGKGIPVNIIGEELASGGDGKSYDEMVPNVKGNYCEPDFNHLFQVMRDVYINYDSYKKRVIKESEEIRKKFTWKNAAKKAVSYLEEFDDSKKFIVNGVEVTNSSDLGFLKDEMNRRIYEKYFRVEDNDVVVDIGSHIGLFSLSVIDRNIKKCYCLEPDDKFYQNLLVNIENSGCSDKFVLVNKAIGDHCGYEFFNVVDGLGVEKSNNAAGDKYLPTISFSDFINEYNIPRIDFLKLDCEGGEYDIISNEENYEFIKNNVKKIAGELHLVKVPHSKKEGLDLINRLKEMGFKVVLNSIDGVDITNYFPSHVDYYTEILFYAEKIKPNELNHILDKAYSVGMLQARQEIESFVKFIGDKKIKNVLEIGTDQGGTFYVWCYLAGEGGKKISLDLPHGIFGCTNYDKEDRNRQMVSWSNNVSIIEGDSHDKKYIEEIKQILNGEEIDLLFIDGDHTYNGVKKDYEMYKTLVRDEGIIAFHDIKDTEFHRQAGCFVHDFWNELEGDKKEFRDDESNFGGIGMIVNKKISDQPNVDNSIFVIGSWADTEEKINILKETIGKAKECLGVKVLLVSHRPVPLDVQEMVDYYIYDECNPILLKADYQKYNSFPLWWFANGEYTISVPQIYRHDYACWTSYQNSFNFVKFLGKKYIFYTEFDWVINVDDFRRSFIAPLSKYGACVGSRSQKNMRDLKNNFDACETGMFSIRTDAAMKFINMFSSKEEFYYFQAENNFFMIESLFASLIAEHIGKDKIHYSDYEDFNSNINQAGADNSGFFKSKGKKFHFYFCEDKENGGCYLFLDLREIEDQCLVIDYNNIQKEVKTIDADDFVLFRIGDFVDQRSGVKVQEGDTIVVEKTGEKVRQDLKENNIDFQSLPDPRKYDNSFLINDEEKILVSFDSKSLGDTIAWMSYVEEFRKKYDCKVVLSTFWNHLFEGEYPEIEFVNPGTVVHDIHGHHKIGWFEPWNAKNNPNNFRTIPLQQTCSDILGLDYKEIKPRITIPDKPRNIEGKYVCVGIHSTTQAKYWNSFDGWKQVANYLNSKGYKVICISKEGMDYMGNRVPNNIIDKTGDYPIEDRIIDLKYADAFIGISSGLSWLSWAVGTPIVMISGFTAPWFEPSTGIERVHNAEVCNSCANNADIVFDKGDWNWCPRNKDFECTKSITPSMVIDAIDRGLSVQKWNII